MYLVYIWFYSRTFVPNTHKFHFKSTNYGLQSSLFGFKIAMSYTFFSVFSPTLENTAGDYGGTSEQLSQKKQIAILGFFFS